MKSQFFLLMSQIDNSQHAWITFSTLTSTRMPSKHDTLLVMNRSSRFTTFSSILAFIAAPTSGSFPYTRAQSMCRYPTSIASFTAWVTSPGLDWNWNSTAYDIKYDVGNNFKVTEYINWEYLYWKHHGILQWKAHTFLRGP